jgi:hypothetical protein
MSTGSTVTNALALLAFVVAFCALLARERKTPYITTFIYTPAGLIFVAFLLTLVAHFANEWKPRVAQNLNTASDVCLSIGALGVLYYILRLHNRQVNFRDDNLIKNLRVVRALKYLWRRLSKSPSYEHSAAGIDPKPIRDLLQKEGFSMATGGGSDLPRSITVSRFPLAESDEVLLGVAAELLAKSKWLFQYTTCVRHPYELILKLESLLGKDNWPELARRIIVVDAFTPHFGFTDSIHLERVKMIEDKGVKYVRSAESYAGIHTAAAKAFNKLKAEVKSDLRPPTLLVYEGCSALVDLESVEQYRVFARHVLTSERMWDGMVTIFVEPTIEESGLDLLFSYADAYMINRTGTGENERGEVSKHVV